ncbi:MAG: dipeptide epimerase [Steroidobacteraceae bacterium]
MRLEIEKLRLAEPFRISDHVFHHVDALFLHLEADGLVGRAEAAGVFYLGDDVAGMAGSLDDMRQAASAGIDHARLARLLPPGGARNAFDCALWDLQAKRTGMPVWELLGLKVPEPLVTTFTIGHAAPEAMAARAIHYAQARAIKIKLGGDGDDEQRIRCVRSVRPDAWLGVDANRSLTPEKLVRLTAVLAATDVALIEQPFDVGRDPELAGLALPLPVAADESIQALGDLERLAHLYQYVNIKLDKCGGLTEGLRLAQRARALGLELMVGNMIGTSLAMAPAFLLGQYCSVVDLDGPIFLEAGLAGESAYRNGLFHCPADLWGSGQAR